jgi:hypothetical protein
LPDDRGSTAGGLAEAPRSSFRRARRSIGCLIVVIGLSAAVAASTASLPEGTEATTLVLRGAIGLGIGIVLIVVVRRMLGTLVAPPPAAPTTVDARRADVIYECPVCGTRVRLEVAATAKPPKHCGEEMEPRISSQT